MAPFSRPAVLSLYRQCLRSVQRIPDADQRHAYNLYVRDGFRSKQGLPNDSRQAIAAIQDAQEQLERMDYYHSIREAKEQGRTNNVIDTAVSREEKGAVVDHDDDNDVTLIKKNAVQEWLHSVLPSLYSDDLDAYTLHLVQEGFDSKQMLEEELLQEDLKFMKTAHRRAVMRRIKQKREERE